MKTLTDSLYMAGIIAGKDILDALKNKNTRANLIIILGMVVFFYWFGTLRPFDRDVSVVVWDAGHFSQPLTTLTLQDGAKYTFRKATSLPDMETQMAYRNLGLVLPSDLDALLASGSTPVLKAYIFWVDRLKVTELEARYSQAFSEIFAKPVRVNIGQNIVVPQADVGGMPASIAQLLVYFIFWTALALIPHLMLEEKQTRTMDALLVSPAETGQIVMGKALAGFFYILLVGGLSLALNWAYIVNWGLVILAFLGYAVLSIGLALAVGSLIQSAQQLQIWTLVLIVLLVVPPLFYMEPMLKAPIRTALAWFPSSALASLFRFSCSSGVTLAQLGFNLAIVLVSILLVFGLLNWKLRRSDR